MIGYFVSIDRVHKKVYLYEIEYGIDPDHGPYETSGLWEPTTLEVFPDYVLLKCHPGYFLRIEKIANKYFEKFCQSSKVSCNGWMQTDSESPYKVTRFTNDSMFLVLAMDLATRPIDVKSSFLNRALIRSGVPVNEN